MTTARLWARVAQRFREERELKAQPLGIRFGCVFRDGALLLRLPYGDYRVGRDELRAAFRLLAEGAKPEELRLVTKYPAYLAAVQEDVEENLEELASGDGADSAFDDEEEGAVEAILVEQAKSLTRAASDVGEKGASAPEVSEPTVDIAAILSQLAEEKSQKEELAREQAGLRVEAEGLREKLAAALDKNAQLEMALKEALAKKAAGPVGIGAQVDWSALVAVTRRTATEIEDPEYRRQIEEAADLLSSRPKLTAHNCRDLLEELARDEYVAYIKSKPLPGNDSHSELMKQLQVGPQQWVPGVDGDFWHIRRTLYSMLSDIGHGRKKPELRPVTLLLFLTAVAAATVTSGLPKRPPAAN